MTLAAEKYHLASSTLAILPRIAVCESDLNPTAKHINKNGSVDFGALQVNNTHKAEMAAMGLDYDDPLDSIQYGVYLASTSGLKPWNSSKSCWSTPIS
jgi:hypothetical protein